MPSLRILYLYPPPPNGKLHFFTLHVPSRQQTQVHNIYTLDYGNTFLPVPHSKRFKTQILSTHLNTTVTDALTEQNLTLRIMQAEGPALVTNESTTCRIESGRYPRVDTLCQPCDDTCARPEAAATTAHPLVNTNTAVGVVGVVLGFLFVQELPHADTGKQQKGK